LTISNKTQKKSKPLPSLDTSKRTPKYQPPPGLVPSIKPKVTRPSPAPKDLRIKKTFSPTTIDSKQEDCTIVEARPRSLTHPKVSHETPKRLQSLKTREPGQLTSLSDSKRKLAKGLAKPSGIRGTAIDLTASPESLAKQQKLKPKRSPMNLDNFTL
jgi:hypothetical protein